MKKIKIRTLDVVLLCVFGYMIYLNGQMIDLFRECGTAPEGAWCALVAALIGECGICGWIKASKERGKRRNPDEEHDSSPAPEPDYENEEPFVIKEEKL